MKTINRDKVVNDIVDFAKHSQAQNGIIRTDVEDDEMYGYTIITIFVPFEKRHL